MQTMNVHSAKTHLSRLLDQVEGGEEVVIARAGKPVARLLPMQAPEGRRVLGAFAGMLNIPEDFDAPLPEDVLALFEG